MSRRRLLRAAVFYATFAAASTAFDAPSLAKYKKLYVKYADAGLAVLEYNISERAPAADSKYKSPVPEPGYPILSRRLSADAKKDYVDFTDFYSLVGAGCAILIDVDGKVVSVRPSADDLEKLLKKRFPNVK